MQGAGVVLEGGVNVVHRHRHVRDAGQWFSPDIESAPGVHPVLKVCLKFDDEDLANRLIRLDCRPLDYHFIAKEILNLNGVLGSDANVQDRLQKGLEAFARDDDEWAHVDGAHGSTRLHDHLLLGGGRLNVWVCPLHYRVR